MWEAIQKNKIKSFALICLMGFVLFLLGASVGAVFAGPRQGIFGGVALAGIIWFFLTVIAMTQGGNILLAFSGAREVSHNDAPQLYNIVEEMKIASALPALPKVYIIESRAPNAFAVGSEKNAAIAVTTGLLSVLSRDELQGVIAHEIGHIKNQDTRFMTIAGVMLGTIVILADMFTRSLFYGQIFAGGRRSRSNSRGGGNQLQLILFLFAIILAILAPLLAQILYFACSRSREYLADASAALFTRLPEALASALDKISSSSLKLEAANRITAPMYIINPLAAKGASSFSLFSTHPPTGERIKILRSMAGGAGLSEYNTAYKKITGKNIISHESMLRSPEECELRGIRIGDNSDPSSQRKKTRDAIDILHKINNYIFIPCSCGLKIKVPPDFPKSSLKCPKCSKSIDLKAQK